MYFVNVFTLVFIELWGGKKLKKKKGVCIEYQI